jgi:hypothetical protein
MLPVKTFSTFVLGLTIGLMVLPQQLSATRQQKNAAEEKRQKKAEEEQLKERLALQSLISYAQSTPPEFAADSILRLVESGKIKDEKWKRQLLNEVFRTASDAQYPFRKTYLPGDSVDTRSGYLANALALNFDRLSLQCRTVKTMLGVDKARARELFNEISQLKLLPLSCEDSLIYDVSIYYQTATLIAQSAFNQKEMRREEHILFAQSCLENINSPAQLTPAIHLITSLKTSASQLERLIYTFSIPLGKISGDDRSFSVPHLSTALIGAMDQLKQVCIQQKISMDDLLASYRKYLVNHFSATRCADRARSNAQRTVGNALISDFNINQRTPTAMSQKEILPITEDEIKPAKMEGNIKQYHYWTSPKSKDLLVRVKKLNFKDKETKFTEEEKQGAEWQWRLSQFLTDLNAWNADDEASEEDYFHQKSIQFYAVINMTPSSRLRDNLVQDLIIFLSTSKLQKSNPIEWFMHANDLIRIARSSSDDDRGKIIEALKQSGSPPLYLYAEMERLFPPPAINANK